ncbi:MAG: prepilin-type N-terminal cleavage/methylation domain-containing protein [Deltaproteobacteria bacterium]|nr:prepilin-type N-terminal cleavage/methylation domain-containing protein [Deltaproteobacteria bacterium]
MPLAHACTLPSQNPIGLSPAARIRGFSLVELMVVLVIIAVLAGVAGFALVGAADQARVTATKQQMSQVAAMVKTYRARLRGVSARGEAGLSLLVQEKLLESRAVIDAWKNPMDFRTNFEGFDFVVFSAGIDRLWDTEDDLLWTNEGDFEETAPSPTAP